jgi:uncharacterized protein
MSGEITYLDSSAIVKLVIDEPESGGLRQHLLTRGGSASCALARVEVVRAVRHEGPDAIGRAATQLSRITLIALSDDLLDSASLIEPGSLRSLDAVHLAAAIELGSELEEVITYDRRLASAAQAAGLQVLSPGATR